MEKTVTLNNGIEMPAVGFGVFKLADAAQCEECVKHAIQSGYRLIDTAAMYRNEAPVGKAVRECGVPRKELFVATKVWLHQLSYDGVKTAYKRSMERLGLDYIDLFMLHWPFSEDIPGAWRAMEELYEEGKVRSIGVCNFSVPYMEKLLETAKILPVVDQMECHPLLQLPELYRYLGEKNIRMEAWSPIGRMNPHVVESPLLNELAAKYGKSIVQIMLRWHYQRGVIAIPKSATPARIEENRRIFDFSLTEEEMQAIAGIDEGFHTNDDPDDPTSWTRLASRPTADI